MDTSYKLIISCGCKLIVQTGNERQWPLVNNLFEDPALSSFFRFKQGQRHGVHA